ncbi:MAG: GerMN domain-containing protein [Clostridiales bacterium]|nr:GerMN domain-containing protein [Clostridiales bacterium]
MRGRLCILLASLLALSAALVGCAATETEEEGILIYYAAGDQETYGQAAVGAENWAEGSEASSVDEVFDRMLEEPGTDGLSQALPDGVRLWSWALEDGVLTLNLSEDYNGLSGISLTVASSCLMLTMTQLEGVESLNITVDGQQLPEGSQVPLDREDVLLTGEIQGPEVVGFQLYFPLSDWSGLGTEYREAELYGTSLTDQIDTVIGMLAAGPGTDGMEAAFADLEAHLDSRMVEGVCVLNLTERWAAMLSTEELCLQALVNSLCELDQVEAVAFDLDDGEIESLEGTFYADYG